MNLELKLNGAHNIQGDAHCGITPIYRSAPVYIFDLDGTISLADNRVHHISDPKNRNWEAFYNDCHLDEPCIAIIHVMQALYEDGAIIRIFTGRGASSAEKTVNWLNQYGVSYHSLHMRPINDHTEDHKMKLSWLNQYREIGEGRRIACVYEDRARVVQMWRDNGIPCMQVAPGDF